MDRQYSFFNVSLFEPEMQKLWCWLVEQCPMSLAHNLITVSGLVINVIICILIYYSLHAKQESDKQNLKARDEAVAQLHSPKSERAKRMCNCINDRTNKVQDLVSKNATYSGFGELVINQVNNLPPLMGIFAQKLINDVIFEAQLGSLSKYTKIVTEPSTNIEQWGSEDTVNGNIVTSQISASDTNRTITDSLKIKVEPQASDTKGTAESLGLKISKDDVVLVAGDPVDIEEEQMNGEAPEVSFSTMQHEAEMDEDDARSQAVFRFSVPNLSRLKKIRYSPPCFIRNLPWKIMVMPRNHHYKHQQHQKSLAFFLQCNVESESSSWSCNVVGELRLLSVKKGIETFTRKIEHLFCSKENDWGFSHFMTWRDVLDPEKGYIKDDTITLEVWVSADAPHGVYGRVEEQGAT